MNRQNTADPVSELFERVNISFKKRELSLLLIVGVIGCIGTMSVFNKFSIQDKATASSLSTIRVPIEPSNNQELGKFDPVLKIGGDFQCNKPMSFTISNYDNKALYEVDYGDGSVEKGYVDEFKHVYEKGGQYDVKLIIHYKDESSTIFGTKFKISPSEQGFLSSL